MKKDSSKKTKKQIAHIVNHTHWDREWRYPMWETKNMLISFMDELIDSLELGTCHSFLLDGQVIPVMDYLEFFPEKKERINKLVKAGKLLIGPWYTLPDEYPVDGEALVRNLIWGNRICKKFGDIFNVGYTSFGWGQTAQLPQIYAGFGIDTTMVGKRVRSERAPDSEFIWRAPDGTELLTTRFGILGRQNFYLGFHLSVLFGVDHKSEDWDYDYSDAYTAFHRADREKMEQDHFMLETPNKWSLDIITQELIDELWETTDASLINDHRLMMNGCDYAAYQNMMPELIDYLNKKDKKKRTWVQTSMAEFVKIMNKQIDRKKLKIVKGELRDGPANVMTANALSTRLYLKILNKKAQNMLIRFAEPMANLTALQGANYPEQFVKKAWKYLLESHPHDSINGVTQDKTVEDNKSRLNQVIDIANTVIEQSMKDLIVKIDMSKFNDHDVLLIVFNPLPYSCKNVVEAWVNMPKNTKTKFMSPPPDGLQIYDTKNNAVNTQWEGYKEKGYCVAELHTRARSFFCHRHRLFFDTGIIPAGGYKIFRAGAIETGKLKKGIAWNDENAKSEGSILTAPNVLENEFLYVEFNPNGTFNLTDKKAKKTFSNLNYFEDRGDVGDYWVNVQPMFNETYNSLGCNARIWSKEAGPLQSTIVTEINMPVPDLCIPEQQRRGNNKVDLIIRTYVTLRAGSDQVEINVEFENKHQDHRLRAMFPTGISNAKFADAGGHFVVDSRPIKTPGPIANSSWPDMATLPMNNFVDISDNKTGIAFLTDCLTEYEVFDNKERTVALTLLKACKDWICTERAGSDFPSQKGGQCFGKHKLRYAVKPHKGNWQTANIPLAAEQFNMPPAPVQTSSHKGTLPGTEKSLFEIDNNNLRFSTLKKTEDRDTIIVRLSNPTDVLQKGNLVFANEVKKAWLTNLNEERGKEIKLTAKKKVSVSAASGKIVTVEIKF